MISRRLSVVIPCFNEGKTIYQNIKKINAHLAGKIAAFEIIAVNDGSSDDTLIELEKVQKEVPLKIINSPSNAGKGKAVREGILASDPTSDVSMFLDADLGIPIEEVEKFLAEINSGADLVIASRFVPGLKVLKPVLWYRKIMERIFRFLRMVILSNWKVRDTQCGFKMFRQNVAQRIFPMATIDRFAFDAEIIFLAKKMGYDIRELPISLQNPESSSVRIFFDPLNMFISLFKIRINDLKGIYPWKGSTSTEKK
jgi:glycosyltransferase involved in cell wall biosynthesis